MERAHAALKPEGDASRAAEVVVERARALPSSLGRCGWRGCRRRRFTKLLVGHARRARAGAGPRAVRLRRGLPDVGRPRSSPPPGRHSGLIGLPYSIAGVEAARKLSCWWRGRPCHVGIAVGVHFAPPGLLLARVVDGPARLAVRCDGLASAPVAMAIIRMRVSQTVCSVGSARCACASTALCSPVLRAFSPRVVRGCLTFDRSRVQRYVQTAKRLSSSL